MAGRLIDEDPELAYEHAQAAARRAGRVDVVREAAALTAYATARYGEALREFRTVRRLSGVDAHRALEADCERGLGRADRALALISGAPADLPIDEQAELAMVEAGARSDLGELEAALSVLDRVLGKPLASDTVDRVEQVRHDVLVALGRAEAREETAVDDGDRPDGDVLEVDDLDEDA